MQPVHITHEPSSVAGALPAIAATNAFATEATDSLIKIPCLEVFVSAGLGEVTMGASEKCHVDSAGSGCASAYA